MNCCGNGQEKRITEQRFTSHASGSVRIFFLYNYIQIISKSQSKVIATTFHYVVELREVGSDQPFSKRLLISGTRGEVSSKVLLCMFLRTSMLQEASSLEIAVAISV